jgi:hypothetical protein
MFFLSKTESLDYFEKLKIIDSYDDYHLLSRDHHILDSINYSSISNNINAISKIISCSGFRSTWSLLLITRWDIFPSSEDQNIFYSFRHSKGEYRHIKDAPGHLFMDYEEHELATMISICYINFYDAYLISQNDYSRFHFSHDEILDCFSTDIKLKESFNDILSL